jgi:MFS family permease
LEFNLLYSVYSFPNIVLPFFGGYLVDFIGVRIGICIFSGLVCLGQAIFAFSADIGSYPVALVGRIVFGLGGESLNGQG